MVSVNQFFSINMECVVSVFLNNVKYIVQKDFFKIFKAITNLSKSGHSQRRLREIGREKKVQTLWASSSTFNRAEFCFTCHYSYW